MARLGYPVVLRLEGHAAHQVHDAAQDAAHGKRDPTDGEPALACADGVFQRVLVKAVPTAHLVEQRHEAPYQEHDQGQQHDNAADHAHDTLGTHLFGGLHHGGRRQVGAKVLAMRDVGELGQVVLRLLHGGPDERAHGDGQDEHERRDDQLVHTDAAHEIERAAVRREADEHDHVDEDESHAARDEQGEATAEPLEHVGGVARFDGGVAALELAVVEAAHDEGDHAHHHE